MVRALGAHGHSRRLDDAPVTSVVPSLADFLTVIWHVSKVPIGDVALWLGLGFTKGHILWISA
jgi:hypothetical protein